MKLTVNDALSTYDVLIENGSISYLQEYIKSSSKILIVTDDNIPSFYYESLFPNALIYINKAGEQNKNYKSYLNIQEILLNNNFSTSDYLITIGGGVIGDLGGFVSSTYKRGMKWINVPTSTLAMIDSCIGGKVAIDFKGVKNALGSFYNPSLVIVDPTLLDSLEERHFYNGLFEALKMGYLYDESLIKDIEEDVFKNINSIIEKSLIAKKNIIERDFYDKELRHQLNFGHTYGHALESYFGLSSTLYHGEAVGYGMRYVVSKKLLKRLDNDLELLHLPSIPEVDIKDLVKYLKNDKKIKDGQLHYIYMSDINDVKDKTIDVDKL